MLINGLNAKYKIIVDMILNLDHDLCVRDDCVCVSMFISVDIIDGKKMNSILPHGYNTKRLEYKGRCKHLAEYKTWQSTKLGRVQM